MEEESVLELMKLGYLPSPDFAEYFNVNSKFVFDILKKKKNVGGGPIILTLDLWNVLSKIDLPKINWIEFESSRAHVEKKRNGKVYSTFMDILKYDVSQDNKKKVDTILESVKDEPETVVVKDGRIVPSVLVLKNMDIEDKLRELGDFVNFFKARYNSLSEILQTRESLRHVVSISKILNKMDKERVAVIGLISDKRYTKNGNIIFKVEDLTGLIDVLVNKNKSDLFNLAQDLVLDEVIGVSGMLGERIIFADDVVFPDISLAHELKKSKDEVFAVFTADLHVGSNNFYKDDFLKFIDWINGKSGDEKQVEIAKKVKYLFIVGDLVDGIGVYPGQENELVIKDIVQQYDLCYELLSRIRKDVRIVICGGNHDALRMAEPQPPLDRKFASSLYNLSNAVFVTNPSFVNINSSEDFPGFDILLYHGFSFVYYANNVNSIRSKGNTIRADLIMKFLLQKRHLAPTHTSSMYIPNPESDFMVIDRVPDFFISGHLHRTLVGNYRNVTLISCGCWVGQTPFQSKLGIVPDPSRISLVNLKTREVKILKFGGK